MGIVLPFAPPQQSQKPVDAWRWKRHFRKNTIVMNDDGETVTVQSAADVVITKEILRDGVLYTVEARGTPYLRISGDTEADAVFRYFSRLYL